MVHDISYIYTIYVSYIMIYHIWHLSDYETIGYCHNPNQNTRNNYVSLFMMNVDLNCSRS